MHLKWPRVRPDWLIIIFKLWLFHSLLYFSCEVSCPGKELWPTRYVPWLMCFAQLFSFKLVYLYQIDKKNSIYLWWITGTTWFLFVFVALVWLLPVCVLNGFSKYLLSPVASVASRQSVENDSLVLTTKFSLSKIKARVFLHSTLWKAIRRQLI